MRKTVLYLFHALFLLVPLFFSSKTDELFEFNKMILTYVIAALILGAWVARMVLEKKLLIKKTPFDIPIALFVLSQMVSTLLSMHPRTSWFGYYSRFNGGLLSILTYLGLYYAFVSNVRKEEVRTLLHTVLYGGLVTALYAIPEHFGHSFSCLLMFKQFDVNCWVQAVQQRVFGTFGQPNWLAAYMVMLIPIAIAFLIDHWKKPLFVLQYSVLLIAYFTTILFTASRSGLFSLIFALGVFAVSALTVIFVKSRDSAQFSVALSMKSLFAPAILTLSIFIVLFYLFGDPLKPTIISMVQKAQQVIPSIFSRKPTPKPVPSTTSLPENAGPSPASKQLPTPQSTQAPQPAPVQQPTPPSQPTVFGTQLENGGTESGVIRAIVWQGAFGIWNRSVKNRLFGSGVETFAYSYYLDRPAEHNLVSEWDFLYNKAHNEFLNYLATTGLFGLGSYLLMIGWVYMWSAKRLLSRKTSISMFLPISLVSASLGLDLSNFLGFSTVMVSILFYLIPAFLTLLLSNDSTQVFALASTPKNTPKKPKHVVAQDNVSGAKIVTLIGIGLVTIFLLNTISKWWRADVAYTRGKQFVQQQDGGNAVRSFEQAIALSPKEALFHDEYSSTLAGISLSLAVQNQATAAAQIAQKAIDETDKALALNPVHLNFYKSRIRIFITLSALEPSLLEEADRTSKLAQQLAPTDPKIVYNDAIVVEQLGKKQEAIDLLKKSLQLKPNYLPAIEKLNELLKSEKPKR